MPRFFFHMIAPGAYFPDEIGSEFPDAETAYLEARQAALEIAFEILREGGDPNRHQFEITDDRGRFLLELPFSEAIRPSPKPVHNREVRAKLRHNIRRSRHLQDQVRTQCVQSRLVLKRTRALLRKSRAMSVT
jgi:hypothetical protein